jgi:hypothetical protein
MASTVTKVSDILTPEIWNAYGAQRSVELSAFWRSGVVASVPGLSIPSGGATITMPHFNALSGTAQRLSDSAALETKKITASKDVAVIQLLGDSWSTNDLAGVLAGADPARAIADLLAEYWANQMQLQVISLLKGAFSAASMATNVSDVSGGGSEPVRAFNQTTFIDATQKLGDAKGKVTAIAMHSATEAYLAKQQMIVYETTANKSDRVGRYLGKTVIVDDGLPVDSGTYTSYIFGNNAIGFVDSVVGESDLEADRDILAGENVMTMRRRFILHVMGCKWKGTPAGISPTTAEIETGTNWERVYDSKLIPIVQFKHKLA